MPYRRGKFILIHDRELVKSPIPPSRKFFVPMPGRKGALTVGRGAGNDVKMLDEEVSRQHLRITWNRGKVWVEDLGSMNGSEVVDAKRREQIKGKKKLMKPEQHLEEGWVLYPGTYFGKSTLLIKVNPSGDFPLYSEL